MYQCFMQLNIIFQMILSGFLKDCLMPLYLTEHFSVLRLKNVLGSVCFAHMFSDSNDCHLINL